MKPRGGGSGPALCPLTPKAAGRHQGTPHALPGPGAKEGQGGTGKVQPMWGQQRGDQKEPRHFF